MDRMVVLVSSSTILDKKDSWKKANDGSEIKVFNLIVELFVIFSKNNGVQHKTIYVIAVTR